jgi:hypothetical protein
MAMVAGSNKWPRRFFIHSRINEIYIFQALPSAGHSFIYNYARSWVSTLTHGCKACNSQQRVTLDFWIMQVHLSRPEV